MFPSKIMDEKVFNDISLNSIAETIITDDLNKVQNNSYGIDIMKNVLELSSIFLQFENEYNKNNAYNFGLIPYYFSQQLITKCKYPIKSSLQNTIDELVSEYIINTTNYRYTIYDIHKFKLLLLNILSILSGKDISIDSYVLNNVLDDVNNIQAIYDTFSYIKNNNLSAEVIINKVISHVKKILNKDFRDIELYAVKMWCYINNVSAENIDDYKLSLKSYYDICKYIVSIEIPIKDELDLLNKQIDEYFEKIFKNFNYYFEGKKCLLDIPINSVQYLCKLIGNIKSSTNIFSVYIYTSYVIYSPFTMKIPSLNNYDEGNGRTAEFLVSKVYEDVINYCIFDYFYANSILYDSKSFFKWRKVKKEADENIQGLSYTNNLVVINTVKFLTAIIKHICPSTFHPSLYKINTVKKSFCHFITDKVWLNIYNILNIDSTYIIINSTKRLNDGELLTEVLYDWIKNLQVIFKPLKNLWNYYYTIDNPSDYTKYSITYTTQLLENNKTPVNNYNTGGDLYSIFNGDFILIDFKKYNLAHHTVKYINNLYVKTLVQTHMYMNMYYKVLGMYIENESDIYRNYYVSAMNPLHNHIVISTNDKIKEIIPDEIIDKYKFLSK